MYEKNKYYVIVRVFFFKYISLHVNVEHCSNPGPNHKPKAPSPRLSSLLQYFSETMDQFHIAYSLKNIPIPSRFQYQKLLVNKIESFSRRLRWKTFFILNPGNDIEKVKETFGFKTTNNPPQLSEIKAFEDDLFKLVTNIKFRHTNNHFQRTLKSDKAKISKTTEVIVPADKSPNLYKINTHDYDRMMRNNITNEYRKCKHSDVHQVTTEAAEIARSYNLEDRIDIPTEDDAFISIKDHKPSFPSKVECRLINPAKNHVGKISKDILDRINNTLRSVTKSNQWLNTDSVIKWFNNIPDKKQKTFFKFDIVSFYPSIQKSLLTKAITWAKSLTEISDSEIDTILHCRKTFLFFNNDAWVKKTNQDFDVSMGSLDSAEICDLVGLTSYLK